MIYIFISFLYVVGILLFDRKNSISKKNSYYYALATLVVLLWGLRYHLGGDSLGYEREFNTTMPTLDKLGHFDWKDSQYQPFWLLLVAIVKTSFGTFTMVQLVHSIIVNYGIFIIIKRYTDHIFTVGLIYFVALSPLFCAEVMRESLAIIPFLFSIKYYIEKKWVRYYALITISAMFHMGALFLFILPFVYPLFIRPWKIKHVILMFIISAVISALLGKIIDDVMFLFAMNDTYERRLEYYMSKNEDTNSLNAGIFGTNIGIRYLMDVIAYMICIVLYKKTKHPNKNINFVLNTAFLLNLLVYIIGIFASRWLHYFNVLFYVGLANILYSKMLNKNILQLGCKFYLIAWCIIMSFWYYANVNPVHNVHLFEQYYPYHSIFDPEKSNIEIKSYLNYGN